MRPVEAHRGVLSHDVTLAATKGGHSVGEISDAIDAATVKLEHHRHRRY